MTDADKTREELIADLAEMRQKVSALEAAEADRKRIEQALHQANERLELALKAGNCGLWEYNVQTGEALFGQQRAEMLGYSLEELELHVKGWWSLVHPEDRSRVRQAIKEHLKGRSAVYETEHRLRAKSGEWKWILARGRIVKFDEEGRPLRFAGTSLDVTRQKQAEEALKKARDDLEMRVQQRTAELMTVNQELLRKIEERKEAERALNLEREQLLSIFDSINEVISVVDAETYEILYVNKFVRDQYGEDVVGGLCYKELHDLDAPCSHCNREMALSLHGQPHRWDYQNPTSNRDYLATDRIIKWTDGRDAKFHLGIDVTEHRKAEEALRTSQAQLSNAVTMAHLGPWEYDVAEDIFTFNDYFFKLFRTDVEQVGGYSMSSADYARRFVHPEDLTVVADEIRKAVETDDPRFSRQLEHRIVYADGEIGYITVRFFIVKDEQGRTVKTYGVNQDITERKRGETALLREKQLWDAIFNVLPGTFYLFDEQGTLLRWNKNLDQMAQDLGREITSMSPLDFFVGDDRRSVEEAIRKGFLEGETSVEAEVSLGNGNKIPYLFIAKRVLLYDKQCLMGVGTDITEFRKMDAALKEIQGQQKAILDNIPDIAWLKDKESRFIAVNEPFGRTCGVPPDDLRGKTDLDVFPLELAERYRADDRDVMASGKRKRIEEPLTDTDGNTTWIETIKSPVYNDVREIIGTVGIARDVWDRKHAEEAVRLSEERYRRLFENAPLIYVITRNEQGVPFISDCNNLFVRSIGHSREEVLERPLADFYSPESRAALLEGGGYTRALAGEFFMGERHLVRRDGSVIPTLLYTTAEVDSAGEVIGTRAMFVDISERKRAAKALEDSEKRYRMLFEAAGDSVYILQADGDQPGRIVSANTEGARMHGYTVAELLKMNITDLDTPESATRLQDRMERLLRGETLREVTTHRRKDGTVFPLEINARMIEVGNRKYVLAIDRDITEREEAQTALRESEQRLRLINDSSPVGIRIVQDGKYVYANPAFVRMFGYATSDRIIGLPIEALYAPESKDVVLGRQTDRLEDRGPASHYEAIGITLDGKRFDLETWETEIKYLGRRSSLAFVMDVSEAKTLRSQLLQAQKMEAIGTLAGGIAHDFNNLLTVILGYSELIISEKAEEDKEYEDLAKILHAARTARDMVQQILAFSRKTETKPRPINLNKEVEQLRKIISRLIPKIIEVEMKLDPNLPTVNADPAQIEQVLMNLAVNARDAMPNGGRLLIETQTVVLDEEYCRFHLEVAQGRYAVLVVRDTGVGIDRSTMDRMFEPFYTTKKPGQGTGLGLAMVYGIVKGHGGHITCESELSSGATFRIYLPAHEVEKETDVTTPGELSLSGEGTILLVDDEELVRDLGQRILQRAGYTVLTATNGKEAIEVYNEKGDRISLVILDLIMPVMDGNQCLKEILKLDPEAQVLISSGYSPDRTTKEALETGAKGFVGKPYNLKQLLDAVCNVLK